MSWESLRRGVCDRPWRILAAWFAAALGLGCLAPDLTSLAAQRQAKMLGQDDESLRAAAALGQAWPDQAYESLSVVALHRPGGLTAADDAYGRRLAARFERSDRPAAVLRVLGPLSAPEVAG